MIVELYFRDIGEQNNSVLFNRTFYLLSCDKNSTTVRRNGSWFFRISTKICFLLNSGLNNSRMLHICVNNISIKRWNWSCLIIFRENIKDFQRLSHQFLIHWTLRWYDCTISYFGRTYNWLYTLDFKLCNNCKLVFFHANVIQYAIVWNALSLILSCVMFLMAVHRNPTNSAIK